MVRSVLIVVSLLALPVSAIGQTHTNCNWIGNTWSCDSQGSGGIDWGAVNRAQNEQAQRQQQMWADIAQQARERRQAQIAAAQMQRQQESQTWLDGVRREVGNRLANGDCVGAKNFALQNGQIELANQAKAYCAAPSNQPSGSPTPP